MTGHWVSVCSWWRVLAVVAVFTVASNFSITRDISWPAILHLLRALGVSVIHTTPPSPLTAAFTWSCAWSIWLHEYNYSYLSFPVISLNTVLPYMITWRHELCRHPSEIPLYILRVLQIHSILCPHLYDFPWPVLSFPPCTVIQVHQSVYECIHGHHVTSC